jgi:hypothetical protein
MRVTALPPAFNTGDLLQRKASSLETANEVPPIVHEVLRSPGRPLDESTRALMEPRLGHDFSQVRVHTDYQAAESARVSERARTPPVTVWFFPIGSIGLKQSRPQKHGMHSECESQPWDLKGFCLQGCSPISM